MKCPQCSSRLNPKDVVRLSRTSKQEAALCAFCGGMAAVDVMSGLARALDACSSCGTPVELASKPPAETPHKAQCASCCDARTRPEGAPAPNDDVSARLLKDALGSFTPIGDAQTDAYFASVLHRLTTAAKCETDAFRLYAVAELGFRSASLPGGAMLAGREILCALEDEAMAAFMIARELAHQQSGRVFRRYRSRPTAGPLGVSLGWGLGLLTAGALPWSIGAADQLMEVAGLGYGSAHELEADEWAMRTIEAAGYDPSGAVRYLELVEKRQVEGRGVLAGFLEVPPARSRRRCLLETLLGLDRRPESSLRVNREGYRTVAAVLGQEELAVTSDSAHTRSEPRA